MAQIKIRVRIIQEEITRAIITLDFGHFVIKGFRIQRSQFPNFKGENLWITPPSYKVYGRYHPMFYMPEKEEWKALEVMIWQAFYAEQIAEERQMLGISTAGPPV